MASAAKKKKNTQTLNPVDRAYAHILSCFGIVAVIELALMGLHRIMATHAPLVCAVAARLTLVCAALTLAGLVLYALRRGRPHSYALGLGTILCLMFTVSFLLIAILGRTGVSSACILFIAAAALFLVFETYRREMFVIALVDAVTLAALSMLRRAEAVAMLGTAALILALFVAAAAAAVVLAAAKNGGFIRILGHRYAVLSSGWTLVPALGSCALCALAPAAALILGASAAIYGIVAVAAALFVAAVYYTVKLM